ncbi:MAG: hypothetical protein JSW73_01760 [Candidatus Woesearchaeota archaeon]|nr:MAG: hypothetical protein JSW73_01760 [Candidatus Woesearchaeota archaeon]
MGKDIDSFDKLREIEAELDSLKAYKVQAKGDSVGAKPSIDYNRLFLESINRSCIRMETELSQITSKLKELVRLFRAAMEGKSPEELEESDKEDKVKKLTEQNEELLRRLNTLTKTMSLNTDYDLLNNLPNTNKEDYLRRLL